MGHGNRKGIPWAAAWLIFCIVCALSAYYMTLKVPVEEDISPSFVTLGTMFLGLIIAGVLQSVGNVIRALIWKSRGYSGTPVVVFFLLFEKGSVKFVSDLTFMFSVQFPKDILKNERKNIGEKLVKSIISVERQVFIDVLVLEVIGAIVAFALDARILLFAIVIAFTASILVPFVNSYIYCGNMVTMMHFKDGNGVYFLIRQLLTFEVKEPVLIKEFIKKEMKEKRHPDLEFFALNGWEEVLFYEILYWENNLTKEIYEHLKKEWIHPFTFEKWLLTPERVNLLIIYMHLIMLRKDDEERRYLYVILDGLLSFENDYNERLENELLFYRDMCMYNPNVELLGSALFRNIDYISFYHFYKDAQEVVFNVIAVDYFGHLEKYRTGKAHWKQSSFEDIPVDSYEF